MESPMEAGISATPEIAPRPRFGYGAKIGVVPLPLFIVLALTRYVSLASILGAASFPIFAWFMVRGPRPAFFIAAQIIVALLIIVKHHPNIRRLLAGNEHRFGAAKTA